MTHAAIGHGLSHLGLDCFVLILGDIVVGVVHEDFLVDNFWISHGSSITP